MTYAVPEPGTLSCGTRTRLTSTWPSSRRKWFPARIYFPLTTYAPDVIPTDKLTTFRPLPTSPARAPSRWLGATHGTESAVPRLRGARGRKRHHQDKAHHRTVCVGWCPTGFKVSIDHQPSTVAWTRARPDGRQMHVRPLVRVLSGGWVLGGVRGAEKDLAALEED